MRKTRTITPAEMRMINRSAILDLVRRESPISRSVIASRLEVSLPTVMRIIDELIEEGLVRSLGITEWSGGRRRALLEFNGRNQVMIGVDISGADFYAAATDLAGNVLVEVNEGRGGDHGESAYKRLVSLLERLLKKTAQIGQKVRGIGVGAPGMTDYQQGSVLLAPALNWHNFPLRERLVEHFRLPVIVDNDVNLSALGEMWFGAGQNIDTLVMIAIGSGIGAGAVLDGTIYRGAHQAAGEIGYLPTAAGQLGGMQDGWGALERKASVPVIIERAKHALEVSGQPPPVDLNAADVLAAFSAGKPWAAKALAEPLDCLAMAVCSTVLCYDPDLVVLGGELSPHLDCLIPPLTERVAGLLPVKLSLATSRLGRRAVVMGAVVNVLHRTSDFYILRSMA